MNEILNFLKSDLFSLIFRLFLSMVIGAVIGADRSKKGSPAGLKTHSLVCIGATLVMLTGEYCINKYGIGDPTRMAAQVISGIGFLGAGTILVTGKNQVKGLTSAAGIWFSACIGLAIGAGFYFGGLLAAFFEVIVIKILSKVNYSKTVAYEIYLEYDANFCLIDMINLLKEHKCRINSIDTERFKIYNNNDCKNVVLIIELNQKEKLDDIILSIKNIKGVLIVSDL